MADVYLNEEEDSRQDDDFREPDFNDECQKWKQVADRLKDNNAPLWGAPFDLRYSEELRNDAANLDEMLDSCVNSDLTIDDASDRLWSLINQGRESSEFTLTLLMYDFSFKCGAVWNTDSVAYRCNTCAKNTCMSLCEECYEGGGHKNHDSTRFFSLAGGACDCGSEDTLHPSGFCSRHGAEAVKRAIVPPKNLLSLTEFVIVKLLIKLFLEYRSIPEKIDEKFHDPKQRITEMNSWSTNFPYAVADFLQNIVDKGAAARRVIVDILLCNDLYARCNTTPENTDVYVGSHLNQSSSESLKYAVDTLPVLKAVTQSLFPSEYSLFVNDGGEQEKLNPKFQNLADELSFWLIRLNFPQPLIDLTLALTSETRYRDYFARSIMYYYEHSIQNLSNLYAADLCEQANELIARMIHVSVQICSSEDVSEMLQKESNAIDKILNAAIRFFSPHVKFRTNDEGEPLFPYITGSGNYTRHRQSYWSFLNDLQNFLSHYGLAYAFLCNQKLVQKYMILIRIFQGANTFVRRVMGDHIENDYVALGQRVFSVEYELESILLMNLSATVKKYDSDGSVTRQFLGTLTKCLETYTNSHNLGSKNSLPFAELSLHLPLHRVLSGFLYLGEIAGECLRFSPEQLDKNFFRTALIHPLKIMASENEAANMWVRNGSTFRASLSFYRHYVFGMSFFDLDMFLIKYAAGVIGPETTLNCIFEGHHVEELLGLAYNPELEPCYFLDDEWMRHMAEAVLSRLCDIATFKMTTPDVHGLRRDTLTTLYLSDSAHSIIVDCLCDRGHEWSKLVSSKLEEVLEEVADFKQPDSNGETLSNGSYTVKKEFWFTEFDPIYCRMRCFNSNQFEKLCLAAEAIDKQYFDSKKKSIVGHFWVPFRLFHFDFDERGELLSAFGSALLCDQKMFEFIGHVLHLALTFNSMTTLAVQQAIYLLSLSLVFFKSPIMKKAAERFWNDDIRECYQSNTLLNRLFLLTIKETNLFKLLIDLFRKVLKDSSKASDDASLAKALREQVYQDPNSLTRITGNGVHYVGRLFCLLYHSNDAMIMRAIEAVLSKGDNPKDASSDADGDSDYNAKRLAMKRKQADILAKFNQKSARILEKFNAGNEGSTSQTDMEVDEELIECSQCKAPAYTLSVADDDRSHSQSVLEHVPRDTKTRVNYAKKRSNKCLEKIATKFFDDPSSRLPCPICRQPYNGFLPIVNPLDLTVIRAEGSEVPPPDRLATLILNSIDNFEAMRYTSIEKKFCSAILRLCKEVTKFFLIRANGEASLLSIIENGIILRSNNLRDHCRRSLIFGAMASRVLTDVKHLDSPFTHRFVNTLFFPMYGRRSENRLKIPTLSCHMKTMFLRAMCFIVSDQSSSRNEMIAEVENAFLINELSFPRNDEPKWPWEAEELRDLLDYTSKEMAMFAIAFMHYTNLKSFDSAPPFNSATAQTLLDYINELYQQDFGFEPTFVLNWVDHYLKDPYTNGLDLTVAEPLRWRVRTLLTLPKTYDEIFKLYHNQECPKCDRISRNPMVCLVCGQLVCIENMRHQETNSSEMLKHSGECGSGNTIFLSVLSSLIIVVQNFQFNVWGSPYLDVHGEEDRQLRRGKPLYLSARRYQFLQRDWLTQVFAGQFMSFTTFREDMRLHL
ncbi:hypothetical protein QR680_001353 [Steinernema hermaphroditum]|uniref:E3 ubiquitin-protein ligase n=1 Tax=Steinernema hermaphroditum TaxID=289476 RepID=A0AA39GXX4_9BILA|nr:hypothetical protein QR680_001353 [Steinernema hermaphroditum]